MPTSHKCIITKYLVIIATDYNIKVIFSILDQNLDHGDVVYICMNLEWRVLNYHAVMFDTYT